MEENQSYGTVGNQAFEGNKVVLSSE